jgi:putative endonuclease
VAVHGNVRVFVEVRARGSLDYGGAAASVNRQKQRRLIRTAQFFLPRLAARYFGGAAPACRFDVVSLEPAGTAWIRDAFAL